MSNDGLESDVCAHFGSCEYFTIVDIKDKAVAEVTAVDNGTHEGEHNCAAPAILLHSHGIDAVLVSGIGGRPLMSLTEKKIKSIRGRGRQSDRRGTGLQRGTVTGAVHEGHLQLLAPLEGYE